MTAFFVAFLAARLCAIRARWFCAMSRSTCASDRAVFDGSSDTFDEPEPVDSVRAGDGAALR